MLCDCIVFAISDMINAVPRFFFSFFLLFLFFVCRVNSFGRWRESELQRNDAREESEGNNDFNVFLDDFFFF